MTTDFRALCAELVATLAERIDDKGDAGPYFAHAALLLKRARAALAQPEPKRRYIYNPVQIAECGGPCEQGPEHCDCGELWLAQPEPVAEESSVAQPADGEVGGAIIELRVSAAMLERNGYVVPSNHCRRAADLLEQLDD